MPVERAAMEESMDVGLWDEHGQPLQRRRDQRISVGSVLPVRLRLLPAGAPPGPWMTADILDISLGGLALLLDAAQPLRQGSSSQLDFSNHPGFPGSPLAAELRWREPMGELQLVGVQLEQPLASLPALVTVNGTESARADLP
ncbi:MAG: PilZ domain-containing protein [Vulcanococcus sp.]